MVRCAATTMRGMWISSAKKLRCNPRLDWVLTALSVLSGQLLTYGDCCLQFPVAGLEFDSEGSTHWLQLMPFSGFLVHPPQRKRARQVPCGAWGGIAHSICKRPLLGYLFQSHFIRLGYGCDCICQLNQILALAS